MNANRSVTATFTLNTYALSLNVSGTGSASASPSLASYPYGTPVTLTATAGTGWHFTGWTGDTTAAPNPLSLVMTRDRSLTANFALNQYALSLLTSGNGTAVASPSLASYPYGTSVSITATPATGWHFTGWTGDTTAAANPLTLVMTSPDCKPAFSAGLPASTRCNTIP